MKPIWTKYHVRWRFVTNLCSSVPKDPEIMARWLDARKPKAQPPGTKSIPEIQEEIVASLAEDEAPPQTLVFQRNEGGLVLRTATIRAHMKDCARVVSSLFVGKVEGERSFAVRIINGCYLDPLVYWTPILDKDGIQYKAPTGTRDKAVHVRGPRGEALNSIKQFETCFPAMIEFQLRILGGCVKESDLATLFEYGGTHGYGGERGDGEGKYTFEIKKEQDDG